MYANYEKKVKKSAPIKMMLVGNKGSGKTALASVLSGAAFNFDTDDNWPLPERENFPVSASRTDYELYVPSEKSLAGLLPYVNINQYSCIYVCRDLTADNVLEQAKNHVQELCETWEYKPENIVFVATKDDRIEADACERKLDELRELSKELDVCSRVYNISAKELSESEFFKEMKNSFLTIAESEMQLDFDDEEEIAPRVIPDPDVETDFNYKQNMQNDGITNFSTEKQAILDLVTARIDKIQSTLGWTMSKDPVKANALIQLYTGLFNEEDDAMLLGIIDGWMGKPENMCIISDHRRSIFKPAMTNSELMINKITALAMELAQDAPRVDNV